MNRIASTARPDWVSDHLFPSRAALSPSRPIAECTTHKSFLAKEFLLAFGNL